MFFVSDSNGIPTSSCIFIGYFRLTAKKKMILFLLDLQNNGVIKGHLYTKQTCKVPYYLVVFEHCF